MSIITFCQYVQLPHDFSYNRFGKEKSVFSIDKINIQDITD